jgi:hypothetical protein
MITCRISSILEPPHPPQKKCTISSDFKFFLRKWLHGLYFITSLLEYTKIQIWQFCKENIVGLSALNLIKWNNESNQINYTSI